MSPKWLQNGSQIASNRLKSTFERPKSNVSVICATKSADPNDTHPFLLFFVDFWPPFGGNLGETIDEKAYLFSMLFFSSFGDQFWPILEGFLELLGGQKSLRSRSRRDLLKSEKTFKNTKVFQRLMQT